MKILITTDWYMPAVNGVVTSVKTLQKYLTDKGDSVLILTLSQDSRTYREGNVIYAGSTSAEAIYPKARLRLHRSDRLVRQLVAWHPDVVHSQCEISTFFIARKVARECGCPLIHTYHTIYEDFTHYFSPNASLGKSVVARFSRLLLNGTQYVIAPTRKVKDLLSGYGVTAPIRCIPTGLNLEPFRQELPVSEWRWMREKLHLEEQDFVLLYAGRLAREKNIEELIRLLAAEEDRHLKLLLVGDGPYRKFLTDEASQLSVADRVVFAGMVPPEQIPRYYRLGDLFVSASQSETQGLTYIEAMASGLPLLCRKDPCLDGVLVEGHNGYAYTDEESFHRDLDVLKNGKVSLPAFASAARETVLREYSAQTFGQRIRALYQEAIFTCRTPQKQNESAGRPEMRSQKTKLRKLLDGISVMGIVAMVLICVYLWQTGVLTSQESLSQMIAGYGMSAALVFILVQMIQVVVPIIPGGISCLVGIILFGAWKGFLYNYIGICLGSVLAFLISKHFGKPLLEQLFDRKQLQRYESWATEKNRFTKLFALAIFFPFAPDDLLCYLAGTTEMSLGVFSVIIFLGKPGSIALYSLGLTKLFSGALALIPG